MEFEVHRQEVVERLTSHSPDGPLSDTGKDGVSQFGEERRADAGKGI
jgi:hypothetical protein